MEIKNEKKELIASFINIEESIICGVDIGDPNGILGVNATECILHCIILVY